MGRLSTFDDRIVVAAIGRLLAVDGQATIVAVKEATGLSTGSLYHRFGSREGMMAEAWLFAVRQFHKRIMAAFALPDPREAAIEAALATPRFCRDEADIALVLACCRPAEFLGDNTPEHLRQQIGNVNEEVSNALRQLAERIDRPLLDCQLAIVAYPLGAVRLFVPSKPVPVELDKHVIEAVFQTLRFTTSSSPEVERRALHARI